MRQDHRAGKAFTGAMAGLCLGGAALFGSACEDSSSPAGGGGFDGGAQFDAPSSDTSTTTTDSSPPTDGGGNDADGGGAPVLGPVSCGAPVDLAGLPGNAISSSVRAAALPGGKLLVVWLEQVTVGQFTPAYRIYDGATWSPTKLLANQGVAPQLDLATDGLGNAYLTYGLFNQPKLSRSVLPVGATTFGAEDLVDHDIGSLPAFRVGALASGALLSYRTGTSYLVSQYDVATSTWGAPTTLATLPGFASGRVGTATTNKAGVAWIDTTGITVRTFDGATWSAPVLDPTAPTSPTADNPAVVPLANGDVYVLWPEAALGGMTKMRGHRYHLATKAWDAIETVFEGPSPGDTRLELRVDTADRLTAAFQGTLPGKSVGAIVARNLGAGWTATALDGLNAKPTLDRNGHVYVETVPSAGPSSLLNRVGVTSPTWLAPTPTGLPSVGGDTFDSAAVAIDSAGQTYVFGAGGGKLSVVLCK